MLKKVILLSSLLVTSMTAHAGIIQYGDYKRDSASNIVIGGGLEWLKWDVTLGMSINAALNAHEHEGWRLATNVEMASLFSSFKFGNRQWASAESVGIVDIGFDAWVAGDYTGSQLNFLRLFGVTYRSQCAAPSELDCYEAADPRESVSAFYGNDVDNNGLYKQARVVDDSIFRSYWSTMRLDARSEISSDTIGREVTSYDTGVALVRATGSVPVAVPTPASIGLLALGLVALGYRRRQVSRR